MNSRKPIPDISYFRLSLMDFLRESHPHKVNDHKFIAARTAATLDVYEKAVLSGVNPPEAVEQTNKVLFEGLYFSKVETLRQGGMLAFITSQGVMNSPQNELVRQWLMNNTHLVSAIRLPNNLMSDNAGTEVGSDLIILQKNSYKTSLTADEQAFIKCRTLSNGITINNYFQDFSRVVQTKSFVDKDLYGKPDMIYLHEGGVQSMATDLKGMLSDDFSKNLNRELYAGNSITILKPPNPMPLIEQQPVMSLYDLFGFSEEERKQVHTKKREKKRPVSVHGKPVQLNLFSQPQIQSKTIKHNTITHNSRINFVYPVFDAQKEEAERQQRELEKPRPWSGVLQKHHKQGSLVIAQNGQMGFLKERYRDDAIFKSLELNSLQKQKVKLYIEIRDTYHSLYNYEAKERKENPDLRQSFNLHYDTFVKRYGKLNDRQNG